MNRRRIFQLFAIAAALMAYLTIVVGGDLTASGAGFACGASWPFCPGGVIPPDLNNPNVATEFTHRVVAFATSLLILATLILALLWYRRERRVLFLSVASFVLLVAQVLLGMATVQSDLAPDVVTAHLALGTATFAAALVLAVISLLPLSSKPAGQGATS
jgi:cytochrome c oxidase assembly protein subunit 15